MVKTKCILLVPTCSDDAIHVTERTFKLDQPNFDLMINRKNHGLQIEVKR